jgi:hypothetical protein
LAPGEAADQTANDPAEIASTVIAPIAASSLLR